MDYRLSIVAIFFGFMLARSFGVPEYHYVNLKRNWTDAQRHCREKYTDLATFENMDDVRRLQTTKVNTSWIGLSDDPKSWTKTGSSDPNSWRWSATGTTSTTGYQRWSVGEPNNAGGKEACGMLLGPNGKWKDAPCDRKLYFLCYTAETPSARKKLHLVQPSRTWEDALAHCRAHFTDLAMIEDEQQTEEAMAVISKYEVWFGLHRTPWSWSDGSKSTFRNWNGGQPNNVAGVQTCVALNSEHSWGDAKCENKRPFICQGARKLKQMTTLRMKFQTDADLSDPAIHAQILQQLEAMMRSKVPQTDLVLNWKIVPRKEETKEN